MTEKNKLIHLTNGETCWLMIGVCLGIIFTLTGLLIYAYAPKLTPAQTTGICCFIAGMIIMFVITKFE